MHTYIDSSNEFCSLAPPSRWFMGQCTAEWTSASLWSKLLYSIKAIFGPSLTRRLAWLREHLIGTHYLGCGGVSVWARERKPVCQSWEEGGRDSRLREHRSVFTLVAVVSQFAAALNWHWIGFAFVGGCVQHRPLQSVAMALCSGHLIQSVYSLLRKSNKKRVISTFFFYR